MSNPWLKKNPFLSMWLSAANRMAGTVRGQASAQAKQQVTAAVNEATHQNLERWSAALTPPSTKKRRARKP